MFYNPYIVIPFVTWLIAQTIKFIIAAFRGDMKFRNFYASGGMPSVHSAVVSSLAITALLLEGPKSSIFGFTAVFAAIVMYDSFGVRRSTGEHAAALNMVIQSLSEGKVRLTQPELKLREVLGHRPIEVAAGALLGVILGGLFNYQKLSTQINFLTSIPVRPEYIAYAGIGAFLVIASIVARIILGIKFKKSVAIAAFSRDMLISAQSIGWLLVLAAFTAYEGAAFLGWRLWPIIILVTGIFLAANIYRKYAVTLPVAVLTEKEEEKRRRWLPKPKKKKKN